MAVEKFRDGLERRGNLSDYFLEPFLYAVSERVDVTAAVVFVDYEHVEMIFARPANEERKRTRKDQ